MLNKVCWILILLTIFGRGEMMRVKAVQRLMRNCKESSPEAMARYFKVQPGQYGAHDKFLGVTMPTVRKVAKDNNDMTLQELEELLSSPYNEERCLALVIMGDRFDKEPPSSAVRDQLCQFYLAQTHAINNWNLVDVSAYKILGEHLCETSPSDHSLLQRLARSTNMWERRISIVSTLAFIRRRQYEPTILISEQLLRDEEDLIHKATGWMLREMGKKDEVSLTTFLDRHAPAMPKIMLSYSLERLSPTKRKHYKSLQLNDGSPAGDRKRSSSEEDADLSQKSSSKRARK